MPSLFRRLRQRFGIAKRPMTVRTHVAWYWRWLGMTVVASLSLAMAAWVYDAGRRFAGFDTSELESELVRLRDKVGKLESETRNLRALADASESKLKIEQSAQMQLGSQVKVLMEENTRLKEDLSFFDNLGPATDKLSIHRFKVDPEPVPGEYRYRLLLVIGGRRDKPFQGSLQLVLNTRSQGRDGMIVLPDKSATDSAAFKLNFKYFNRVESTFRLPRDVQLQSVQVRVFETGSDQARAVQTVNPS